MRVLSVWTFLLMAVASVARGTDTTSTLAASDSAPVNTTASATAANAPPTDQELENLSKSLEELLGEPLEQLMEEAEARERDFPSDLFENGGNNVPESYSPMSPQHKEVKSLVSEFMRAYESEIEATNLDAEVLRVIKAEVRTLALDSQHTVQSRLRR